MLIDPEDLNRIGNLAPGEVAFPDIPYEAFPGLNRPKTTIHGAYTIINDRIPEYLDGLNWDHNGSIAWQNEMLNALYFDILTMIDDVDINIDHELKKIFIYIHLWGGISGRGFFVKNGGFDANFDSATYRLAINHVREGESMQALHSLNSLPHISTAFTTKHMHFWSKGELPIYDSVISKVVFGRGQPHERYYVEYTNALDNLILELQEQGRQATRRSIERSLFNWASDNGTIWSAARGV